MAGIIRFERSMADSILTSALDTYPREVILPLRGRVDGDAILISDVLIPPLAIHARAFSFFPMSMLPLDLRVVGVSHSHPSGALRPSTHDVNHFYGRIMVITAYPFQSYSDIGVFNNRGERIPHEVVADEDAGHFSLTQHFL
jgi:proteasome lid subunit RPN8/RPN11